MVEIKNLTKRYGKLTVLDKINLSIPSSQITAILGPNGSGKTTLIKSILGLVKITDGQIIFDGKDIKNNFAYRRRIGYMPQIGNYPQNLTVIELIKLILDLRFGKSKNSLPDSLIEYFELKPYLNKFIRTLSGGTNQKLSAVLALMSDADVYFLDEPTTGLDPITSAKLKNLIHEEQNKGKTFIIVSHQLNEVQKLADKLIFLLEGKKIIDQSIKDFIDSMHESDLENAIFKFLTQRKNGNGSSIRKQNNI